MRNVMHFQDHGWVTRFRADVDGCESSVVLRPLEGTIIDG
jgi:hypothetical protein